MSKKGETVEKNENKASNTNYLVNMVNAICKETVFNNFSEIDDIDETKFAILIDTIFGSSLKYQIKPPQTISQKLENYETCKKFLVRKDNSIKNMYNNDDYPNIIITLIKKFYMKKDSTELLQITQKELSSYLITFNSFREPPKDGNFYIALLHSLNIKVPFDKDHETNFEEVKHAFQIANVPLILNSDEIFKNTNENSTMFQIYLIIDKLYHIHDTNSSEDKPENSTVNVDHLPSPKEIISRINQQNVDHNKRRLKKIVRKNSSKQIIDKSNYIMTELYKNSDPISQIQDLNQSYIQEFITHKDEDTSKFALTLYSAFKNKKYNVFSTGTMPDQTTDVNSEDPVVFYYFDEKVQKWIPKSNFLKSEDKKLFLLFIDLDTDNPLSTDICKCLYPLDYSEKENAPIQPGVCYYWDCKKCRRISSNNEIVLLQIIYPNDHRIDTYKSMEKFIASLLVNSISLIVHANNLQVDIARETIERILRYKEMIMDYNQPNQNQQIFIIQSYELLNDKEIQKDELDNLNQKLNQNNPFIMFKNSGGITSPLLGEYSMNICSKQTIEQNNIQTIFYNQLFQDIKKSIKKSESITEKHFNKYLKIYYDRTKNIPEEWFCKSLDKNFNPNKEIYKLIVEKYNESQASNQQKNKNKTLNMIFSNIYNEVHNCYNYGRFYSADDECEQRFKDLTLSYIATNARKNLDLFKAYLQQSREELSNMLNSLVTISPILLQNYKEGIIRERIIRKYFYNLFSNEINPEVIISDDKTEGELQKIIKTDKEEIDKILKNHSKNLDKKEVKVENARESFENSPTRYALKEVIAMRQINVVMDTFDVMDVNESEITKQQKKEALEKHLEKEFPPDY